tara:strand:- start:127 stop:1281 length:1155 start_codon:yes stop_codon:yes gene_type:complete
MKRVVLISILLLCLGAPMNAQAQFSPIGIELDCDQQNIEINVHPQQNAPVNVGCTLTSTSSFNQQIKMDYSTEENGFRIDISISDTVDLEAGEEIDFTATFTATSGMEVKSSDYNLSATIESFGQEPIMVPAGMLNQIQESNGQVSSMPYSMLSFSTNKDTSTIVLSEEIDDDDGWFLVELKLVNDGNFDDTVIVEIVNLQELADLDITHSFYSINPLYAGISEYRQEITAGATSQSGYLTFGIDKLPSEDFTFEIELRAYSLSDGSTDPIDLTLEVQVGGSDSSGGVLGLDTVSNSDLKLVGMAGGGLFAIILLLVFISRLTKKAGKQKIAAKQAKKAAKANKRANKSRRKAAKKAVEYEEEIEDDFDDDFDDLDDDFDFEDL